MLKYKFGLGKKVAVIVLGALLIFSVCFALLAHITGYRMLEKQAQAKAGGIAEFGKGILEHLMVEGKRDKLKVVLKSAIVSPQINDVMILDRNGIIAVRSTNKDIGKKFKLYNLPDVSAISKESFFPAVENKNHYQYVVNPVFNKTKCYSCHGSSDKILGYYVVKASMDDLLKVAQEHRSLNIILTLIIVIGVGVTILLALYYIVIKPVNRLKLHMNKIGNEVNVSKTYDDTQFSLLRESKRNDEISDLEKAFNKLTNRLNESKTKLNEMQQNQLEQADRMFTVGEMAASLAHEIKNPISGVIGALQIFDSETQSGDAKKEIIEEMMSLLQRVNNAVNDLLSYARPKPPVFETIDVKSLINKTLSLITPLQLEKNINYNVVLSDESLVICADRNQLQQVLFNLMLNALQAMSSEGTLNIIVKKRESIPESFRGKENSVEIEVIDNGQGIKPETLPFLFKPFFTTKHKGTGLGLAISKRIIEQHNGSIEITSELGKGTKAKISLPLEQNGK
ncbi:MAG: ATP-binding protein [Bacteroidetes bacterium]|nr:ATP-binding protein [Bacteroidota bacterium]